jgi:undecaprenyl-diphosphatase
MTVEERAGTGRVRRIARRPLEHFTARSFAALVAVVLAGVVFGVLLTLVRFHFGPLYDLDHGAAEALNRVVSAHHRLVTVLQAISTIGGRPVMIWLIVMATVMLFIRRQPRLAIFLLVAGVGALVLDPFVKTLVGRLRPVVDVPVAHAPGNSFPSGHALGSFVAYGALLLVFLPAVPPRWRKAVIALTATLIVLIGLSRVALGVHFVSDVIAGWLLGAAWLGATLYAFRLWRREVGRPAPPVTEGLEPEAGPAITPAPDERKVLPHPWVAAAEVLVAWVLVFGAIYGFGMLVSYHTGGSIVARIDSAVPHWFADHRDGAWDGLSWWASKAGDTHAILAVSLVVCPLMLAAWRRWRPVVFVVLVMFGELTLFLASQAAVDRPRPDVTQLDKVPTGSYPSGHIAATMCLYVSIALLVMPRTDRWWRWVTAVLAVVMPVIVAVSRFYRGMHHPTDVVGALLLTGLWVGLLWWVIRPNADLAEGDRRRRAAADVDVASGREYSTAR